MSYTSNMGAEIGKLNVQLKGIKNQENLLRDIAVSLERSNLRRIHNEGKNVAGGKIGTYTPVTMAIRKRSDKISPVNRSSSTNVILSFTGKLSKEFQASAISDGWGVGFTTTYGSDLFKILTDKYGDVWGITSSDNKAIEEIVSKEITKKLAKLRKKDFNHYVGVRKKMDGILPNPKHRYKNLHYDMKGVKRIHIGHFVLVFRLDKKENLIFFEDFDHHDNIYKKKVLI